MYKYRGVPFVDVADNKGLQKIINAYSKKSGAELLDFTKTKAIKVLDANGKPVAFREQILKSFKEATDIVTSGKQDFYTTMRKTVLDLGGSGARVEYPNGLTRRLDTVVRQNMLYNGKMASREYNKQIGKELGTDGIEIDLHANSRPSHRFMEGKQYAKGHGVTVNGVYYEGAIDKGVYDRLYVDYNCQHYETDIILGVSEPRYSPEELARLKAENEKEYEINGISNTLFYAGDMKDILNDEFIAQHGRPDVIITDPPRAGMHQDVVDTILRAEPKRIVYVSCNPATQARDLQLLDAKYKVTAVQPVDMFPHTPHVENVVALELK